MPISGGDQWRPEHSPVIVISDQCSAVLQWRVSTTWATQITIISMIGNWSCFTRRYDWTKWFIWWCPHITHCHTFFFLICSLYQSHTANTREGSSLTEQRVLCQLFFVSGVMIQWLAHCVFYLLLVSCVDNDEQLLISEMRLGWVNEE